MGDPILNAPLVADLLEAILLPDKVAVCKCAAHTRNTALYPQETPEQTQMRTAEKFHLHLRRRNGESKISEAHVNKGQDAV